MKLIRRLFVLFSLVLLVGVIGVGIAMYKGTKIGVLETIIQNMMPAERTFHDAEFGISFRYPREWEQQYVSPNIILFFGEGAGPTMTLVLAKRKEAETLQQFGEKNVREIRESAADANKQIEVGHIQKKTLGRLPAEQFTYRAQEGGGSIDGLQVWAVDDKKEYSMTFAARQEAFETAVQAFDSVFKSVKIQ